MEGYFLLTKKTGPGVQQPDKLSCMWDCVRHDLSLLCGLIILVHGAGLSKILRGEARSSRPQSLKGAQSLANQTKHIERPWADRCAGIPLWWIVCFASSGQSWPLSFRRSVAQQARVAVRPTRCPRTLPPRCRDKRAGTAAEKSRQRTPASGS